MSAYAQEPKGKAASLAANEKTSTPKGALPKAPPKRPRGEATVTALGSDATKEVRRSKPAYPGEKPAGVEPVPAKYPGRRTPTTYRPYYAVKPDTRSGVERAVDRQVTPMLAAAPKLASPYLTTPANVAGNVLAQLSGAPTALSAAEHLRHAQVLPAAAELASLLPVGRFGRAAKAAKEALAAEGAAKEVSVAARVKGLTQVQQKALQVVREGVPIDKRITQKSAELAALDPADAKGIAAAKKEIGALRAARRHVVDVNVPIKAGTAEPYVATGHEGIDELPDFGKGYSYHRAPVEAFAGIRQHGLSALSPRSDEAGVYFGQSPLSARGLSWKSLKGSVFVRARTSSLKDVTERAFGEHLTPHSVPPGDLEYLGSDGAWHPVGDAGHAVPRIDPHNHKLIDIYESALAAEPKDLLRGTLKGAHTVRAKQEVGYSAERGERFAAARKYLNDKSLEPDERIALAKNELRGELPKINFQGMNVLDDNALKVLKTHILDHPYLMEGQKIKASDALTNALAGKVPTTGELKLLEHVFGKETADGIGKVAEHPFRDTLLSALNIPRSIMASFDLSAPFRQGLTVATRHPAIFARNFKPMVKAFGSENVYHATLDEIRSRPTYPLMMEGKLSLTELGHAVGAREEQFQSDLAEKIPGVGHAVRASGRAYTGFLDKTRADVFDHLIGRAQAQGIDIHGDKFLHDLGRYVNTTTGRGPLGNLQGAASALNALFFSPRLLASRLDLLFSPITYAKADPFVRREAIRSMVQLAGTASVLVALAAQIKGVKVVTDPRNPDWGKIKHGHTRIDIGGGFQQPLRLFAQLATGVAISSTTGKKLNLTAGGFGQPNRLDLFLRFFEGKESPIAALVTDKLRNSDQVGNKFSWRKEAVQHLTPLLAQDTYDVYKDQHGGVNGLAAAFAGYGIGGIGFGLQTYPPKTPKPRASASTGDPYSSGSGYGGGSPYADPGYSAGSAYSQLP